MEIYVSKFTKGFRNTEIYMYHENSDIGPFIHTVIKIGNIKVSTADEMY